ncbi:MAG: PilZ domain-containing protein [Pseudomonadota bacterium]
MRSKSEALEMSVECPACQKELPSDARYCGFCGFRLAPISSEAHLELSERLAKVAGSQPRGNPPEKGSADRTPSTPKLADSVAHAATLAPVWADSGLKDQNRSKKGESEGGRDRRGDQRFPLRVRISYVGEERSSYGGIAENVSSGGLFVATLLPAQLGDFVELSFPVPGLNKECSVACRVRWIRAPDPKQPELAPGVGLEFHRLGPEARAAIELFIQHRDPSLLDD